MPFAAIVASRRRGNSAIRGSDWLRRRSGSQHEPSVSGLHAARKTREPHEAFLRHVLVRRNGYSHRIREERVIVGGVGPYLQDMLAGGEGGGIERIGSDVAKQLEQ